MAESASTTPVQDTRTLHLSAGQKERKRKNLADTTEALGAGPSAPEISSSSSGKKKKVKVSKLF